MSQQRKIQRRSQFANSMLDVLLFGGIKPANDDCLEERRNLIAKFRKLMGEFKTQNAPRLFQYLKDARDKNTERPVGSYLDLIDDIEALRSVEAEIRKETQPTNGAA